MVQIQRPSGVNVGVLNPGETVYVKGSENVDGSFRVTLNDDDTGMRIEERVSGVWELTSLELSDVVTGLTEGQVPKADSDGTLIYGGATVDSATGEWTWDASGNFPQGSVKIGELVKASEGGSNLVIADLLNNQMAFSVNSVFQDATGASDPFYYDYGMPFTLDIQIDDTEIITTNPITYSIPSTVEAPDLRLIDQVTFRANGPMTNVTVSLIDQGTGLAAKYFPSKAAFEGREPGFNIVAGDVVFYLAREGTNTASEFYLGFTPIVLQDGQIIDVTIKGDNIDLLGDDTGQPYQTAEAHDGSPVVLTEDTNIYNSDGTISGEDRFVKLENASSIDIESYDTDATDYLERSQINVSNNGIAWTHAIGNGDGTDSAGSSLVLYNTGAFFSDGITNEGFKYFTSDDYSNATNLTMMPKEYIDSTKASIDLSSTRIVTGSEISINAGDSSLWDLAAGSAEIFRFETLEEYTDPVKTELSWDAQSGLAVTGIATIDKTNIGITNDNTAQSGIDFSVSFSGLVDGVAGTLYIAQKAAADPRFSIKEKVLYAEIGRLFHRNLSTLNGVANRQSTGNGLLNKMQAIYSVLGLQNINGNDYGAVAATDTVEKSAGEVFDPGTNATTDPEVTDTPTTPQDTEVAFLYDYWDGSDWVRGFWGTSFPFDTWNDYDNGTLEIAASNKWLLHYVFLFSDTNVSIIQLGQVVYSSYESALADFQAAGYNFNDDLTTTAIYRGAFICRAGETTTDGGDWYWVEPSGSVLSGQSSGSALTTLQTAYDASIDKSTLPEIIVQDVTTGAVTIQDSATNVNRDTIFHVLDADSNELFCVEKELIEIGGDQAGLDRVDTVRVSSNEVMSIDCGDQGTSRFFVSMLYGLDLMQIGYFDDVEDDYIGLQFESSGITAHDDLNGEGIKYSASTDYANPTTETLMPKSYIDANSIYLTDVTFTNSESRQVTGEGDSDFYFRFFDLDSSTFTKEGSLLISDDEVNIAYHDGSGAGAQTDTVAVTVSGAGGIELLDSKYNRGATYNADYSANYTNRSLVDKEYVDNASGGSDTIYTADGTLAGPLVRTVTGENDADLNFIIQDVTSADYSNKTEILMDPERLRLRYDEGDGTGSSTGFVELDFDGSGIVFTNTVTTAGITYAADYSSNYTNRSLVDKAYADSVPLGQANQSIEGPTNRSVVANESANLEFRAHDTNSSDYTDRSEFILDPERLQFRYDEGDGTGGSNGYAELDIDSGGITFTNQLTSPSSILDVVDDTQTLFTINSTDIDHAVNTKFVSSQTDSGLGTAVIIRDYFIQGESGGGAYYIGNIRDAGQVDGGIDLDVHFSYDYGTQTNHFMLHTQFAQRNAGFDAYWYTTGAIQSTTDDVVYVTVIDDGANNYEVWVVSEDFSSCRITATMRQGGSWVDSGILTSQTITAGTSLADTRDDPTAIINTGYILAANPILQTTNGTDVSTNLNTASFTPIPIFNATDLTDDPNTDFKINSSTEAEFNFDGRAELSLTMVTNTASGAGRVSLIARFYLNGVGVGPASQNYIRGTNNADEGTNTIAAFQLNVSSGDTIDVRCAQGSTVTATTSFKEEDQNFCMLKRVK